MASGTVKWFSEEKRYGFIEPNEGDEEIFVHYTDIEGEGFRSLTEGESGCYEATSSTRGARRRKEAKIVRRVEWVEVYALIVLIVGARKRPSPSLASPATREVLLAPSDLLEPLGRRNPTAKSGLG